MIASLGEALIDFTPLNTRSALGGFHAHPGGSPFNVAVGLSRLGHPAAFAGKLSSDMFGSLLRRHLVESGVSNELLLFGPESTPLAFVAVEGGEPTYSFRFEGSAATAIGSKELVASAFSDLACLHFGSINLLFEPAASSTLSLLQSLKGRVTLSFDPNFRPDLAVDIGPSRTLLRSCFELADIVKLSQEDADYWQEPLPRPGVAAGPVALIVTNGAAGSTVEWPGGRCHIAAVECQVVDTVGAGDAYTAGLLVALAERGALARGRIASLDSARWEEILRFASTAAALACEVVGATPPTRSEVEDRLVSPVLEPGGETA